MKKTVREIWESASAEKRAEALDWARVVTEKEVTEDKLLADIEAYQQDVAPVEIKNIDDIINLIG